MNGFAKQLRGFNLVEMMIILAVVGLLSGAVLVPFFNLNKDDIYETETRKVERIRTAIFGYATRYRNRGGGVTVVVQDADGQNGRPFVIPSGRPFLPCPDVDGDGYEDRENSVAGFFPTLAPLFPSIPVQAENAADVSLRFIYRCESPRGVLPWRTLGTPPADSWGNLYTYSVDEIFADGRTGFNQNTKTDIYDPRTILTVVVFEEITGGGGTVTVTTGNHLYTPRSANFPPLVICDGTDACESGVSLTLAAGQQAGEPFSELFRDFADATDVVEGVPFAIVSHGENGLGAADYERTITSAGGTFVCSFPIFSDPAGGMTVLVDATPEAFNFPVVELPPPGGALCADATSVNAETSNGFMIARQRVSGGFDDIVIWTTRDELLDAMYRGGVLPAPDLPALRPY